MSSLSFQKQNIKIPIKDKHEINPIEKIIPIQHPALNQYLKSRNITYYQDIEKLKEIHYSINDKKYFGLGFLNNSQGWELRSKFSKICLGKKDITLIDNKATFIRAFEGFIDYLSFIQISDEKTKKESDYLILNSVALIVKNIALLNQYEMIQLYLDNDETGEKYTNIILEKYKNATDCRSFYHNYKDLNDWLMKS